MTRSGWPRSSILSRPIHSSMLLPLQVAPSIWAPISQQTGTMTGVRGRSGTEAAVEAPLMNFSGFLTPPFAIGLMDTFFSFVRNAQRVVPPSFKKVAQPSDEGHQTIQ